MSNGIYPQYVGPTIEYRYNSLYPSWVRSVIGAVIPPSEFLGGIEVLANPYAVIAAVSNLTVAAQRATTAVRGLIMKADVIETEKVDVEVVDEDLGL